MAAAADRLVGDALEILSPELVLVDASLREELLRRLDVADDTLSRISRETEPAVNREATIEDLIVIPLEERPNPPKDLPVRTADTLTPGPPAFEPSAGIEDLIVVCDEDQTETKRTNRMYPPLPSPAEDAYAEDATDVVLRQIRDHLEPEPPADPPRLRLVSLVPILAAASALALLALDGQPGLSELPRWLPS